jgi:hypothetical protein
MMQLAGNDFGLVDSERNEELTSKKRSEFFGSQFFAAGFGCDPQSRSLD